MAFLVGRFSVAEAASKPIIYDPSIFEAMSGKYDPSVWCCKPAHRSVYLYNYPMKCHSYKRSHSMSFLGEANLLR